MVTGQRRQEPTCMCNLCCHWPCQVNKRAGAGRRQSQTLRFLHGQSQPPKFHCSPKIGRQSSNIYSSLFLNLIFSPLASDFWIRAVTLTLKLFFFYFGSSGYIFMISFCWIVLKLRHNRLNALYLFCFSSEDQELSHHFLNGMAQGEPCERLATLPRSTPPLTLWQLGQMGKLGKHWAQFLGKVLIKAVSQWEPCSVQLMCPCALIQMLIH